jgi:hypothetical protein
MKIKMTNFAMAVCASGLMTTMAMPVLADQATAAAIPDKTYTGMVVSTDQQEHVLTVRGWAFSKKSFNLGDGCNYTMLFKNPAGAADLRDGQKVTVAYQDAHGVLIANRVSQEPMRYEGMVKAMDPDKHALTLHSSGSDKTLQMADNCQIVLRNGKVGTYGDIKVGNHVTITYEKPGDMLTAYQIAQTSIMFTGKLTAIDLDARTVKAKTMFESKKFNVADNCSIVINNKPDGHLADLRPDEKLAFSYDEINGVNVVNRIAPADEQQKEANPVAATGPVGAD